MNPKNKSKSKADLIDDLNRLVNLIEDKYTGRWETETVRLLKNIYGGDDSTVFVIDVDKKGDFRFVWNNLEHITSMNIKQEEFYGKTPDEVTFISPDTAKRLKKDYNRCIKAGTKQVFETKLALSRREVDLLARVIPLKNEKGRINRLICIYSDITTYKTADKKFLAAREQAQLYLDIAGVIMVAIGRDKKVSMINKKGCEVLGYKQEEIIGKSWFDNFIPGNRRKDINKIFDQFIKGKGSLGDYFENEVLCRNGEVKLIAWYNTILKDDKGNITGTLSSGEDITERRSAEIALREREAILENIIKHTREVFYMHDMDNRIQYISPFVTNLLGYSLEELTNNWENILIDNPANKKVLTYKNECQTKRKQPKPYIIEIRKKNGDIAIAEISESFVRDEGGNVVAVSGVARDITIQKKAETALHKSERMLRNVLDNIHEVFFMHTIEGEIVYVSPFIEQMLGVSIDDVRKNWFKQLYEIPENREVIEKKRVFNKKGTKVEPYKITFKKTDGKKIIIEVNETPIKDSNGRVFLVAGAVRDVTEQLNTMKALEEALVELEKYKDQLHDENIYLREEIQLNYDFEEIISQNKKFRKVLRDVEQVASTDATVLILGETGTGKELIARAIHNISKRQEKPLVKLNCAAIPVNLLESELFGHEKGSFTGAIQQKVGRFELANGGTVFLDEIGELPTSLQPKLLRVLQDGEFERIGSNDTIKVDVRVIAATNRDLQEEIRKGNFREDLYYRLSVFPITIPPLRERKEDIPLLVNYFIEKFTTSAGKTIDTIPKKTMTLLREYSWPGNVRELENIVERAIIVSRGNKLEMGDWFLGDPEHVIDDQLKSLQDVEKEHILKVLRKTNWRVSGDKGAAKILNLKPTTLEARMKKLQIFRPN